MASPLPRRPVRRPRPACALVLGLTALLAVPGCKSRGRAKRRAREGCTARKLKDVRLWLADLCAAAEKSFPPRGPHWQGLRLAQAGVQLEDELPRGVLVHLTRERLLIDGKPAPDWPKPRPWRAPSMRRGAGPVLSELLPKLRKKLSANALVSQAASTALQDLQRRARPLARRLRSRPRRGPGKTPTAGTLPSGLTLLTLTMAKVRLPGQDPRAALVAIDPDVELWRIVQLQPLLLMAGFEGLYFLFSPRVAPDPPAAPDPRLYSGLGRIVPGRDNRAILATRRRGLAQEERAWIDAGCDALGPLRKALHAAAAGDRCRTLESRLPVVLKACRCARDERALLTLWLAVSEPFDFLGSWHGTLHPRAKPVTAGPQSLWRDLADQVAQRQRKTLWFALR